MASVRDDDVVGQVYVHGLGGFPHEFRQLPVVVAGVRVAGGMIVDKGYPPRLMRTLSITLAAWFISSTQNSSVARSQSRGWNSS